jgi:hypothetical protein
MCFINVDFPEPALPLTKYTPWPVLYHSEKIEVVRYIFGRKFSQILILTRQPSRSKKLNLDRAKYARGE